MRAFIVATVVVLGVGAAGGAEAQDQRPADFSVGIGLGWDLPADLTEPDTVGVRLRFPSGLTFEPLANLSVSRQRTELGPITSSRTVNTVVRLAGNVRFPVISRGPVDFVGLGGARVSYERVNPQGVDNATNTTSFGLAWGLGLDYWWRSRWVLSFTATNPLFDHTTTEQESIDSRTSSTRAGAIFEPDVLLMIHLFF